MNLILAFMILIFTIGILVFILNHAALPMYALSQQFAKSSFSQQEVIAFASERLLTRGANSSVGVFPGFALCNLASMLLSICMIQGNRFSRSVRIIGLIGTNLVLFYLILVTFLPDSNSIAMGLTASGVS